MKLFIKITAGFLVFMILLIVGLNIYFTDERLRSMVVPRISEALDRDVQIDRMSLTLFRSFPQAGLRIEGVMLPDDHGEAVMRLDEMVVAVRLFPLLQNNIDIRRLDLDRPQIFYTVYEDETTNMDFLFSDTSEETESEYTIQIPRIVIRNAGLVYRNEVSNSTITLEHLDAEVGLRFAELIESTVDARLQSLSVLHDGTRYIQNLSLELQQTSTIDLEQEVLTLAEGVFTIRGFALNISGSFSRWSSNAPEMNLQFTSSSENFGELLRLAPPEYEEYLRELETSGRITLEGSVAGSYSEETLPDFNLTVRVSDGYLKNPDLQEPIQDIHFSLLANNHRIELEQFNAVAAGNQVRASGTINRPFEEDAHFLLSVDGDVDLATVSRFYPIDQFGVEQLGGILSVKGSADGTVHSPEEAMFNGVFSLNNGMLKYIDVPHAIEAITADIAATQDIIQINSASLRALTNRFSMSGTVTHPLAEQPEFNIAAMLDFDLATIKDFYPIDEDTLTMRGQLKADVQLRGQAEQIEKALQQSTLELRNGYFAHSSLGNPLDNITLIATANSTLLTIQEGRFTTGNNIVSLNGSVQNFLDEQRNINLNIDATADLADVTVYYSLDPWINELSGNAILNLNVQGPVGDPLHIALNGNLELSEVNAMGDSLILPVTDLQGILKLTPEAMDLEGFFMKFGESDFQIEGRLQNYLGFLQEHDSEATMPVLSGSYKGHFLNIDEMIDWDEERVDPFPIHLPKMVSTVTAEIETLQVLGVTFTQLRGNGRINPEQIIIDEAEASIFDGKLTGQMTWSVPKPDHTLLRFRGELHDLTAESLFREYPILGQNGRFHEYVTGAISANVEYYTEMNDFFEPDVESMEASGTFGMTRSRLQGHPVQEQLATWLNTREVANLALDEWTATFSIHDAVLGFTDFRLTSENIGIELTGTHHLITDEIDFTAQLLLPGSFRGGIASVISSQAVDALSRDDGIIVVPVRITGTMDSPAISARQNIIEDIVQEKLQDAGRDVLRNLLNRN